MDSFLKDLRYGARILWKIKGLALVAVASLAVGIGTNAAIFTLVNSSLLLPRPFADPERVVELYAGDRQQPYQSISHPSYLDLRDRNGVLSGLAAYGLGWQFKIGGANEVEQVWGEPVSGNYFAVLGVRPHIGRTFLPEEDSVPGRNPVVVLGYALWQRKFNSDPAILGKSVTVNNQQLTVVGIAPPEYTGMVTGWASEIFVPITMLPLLDPSRGERMITSRGNKWLKMIGRLQPGTSLEQTRARFAVLTKELQAAQPDEWIDRRSDNSIRENFISVLPERATRVHPQMRAPVYALVALLFVIVDLVLVIACMNLAGLFFARAVARRSEIAIRLALGAGRGRIMRQLLTESVLISVVAGAFGALLAVAALRAAIAYMPPLPEGIRVVVNMRPDWRVVLYTAAFSTITGLLFGLAPALRAYRGGLATVMKEESNVTARFSRSRARASLVVAQVALSLLLLIGAGLVLRSLEKVRPTRLGFASQNFVTAQLVLDEAHERAQGLLFFERVSEQIAALPGVRSVSLVDAMPGGFLGRTRRGTGIEGYTFGPNESQEIDANIVGPHYFTNLRVPIVAGRDFDERDRADGPCVALINEAFAQRYLSGTTQALGKHLVRDNGDDKPPRMCEIVGIFRDNSWQSLNRQVRPFYALPLQQLYQNRMTLLVETAAEPASMITAVRRTIQRLDPNMPVSSVQTVGAYFNSVSLPFRLFGLVVALCGVLALLLAIVGIYGTISYTVAQRRREVGIRRALGAVHGDIIKLVVGQGMRVVLYGLGIGLLLGLALTRVLTSLPLGTELLFGVSATDILTFSGVTVLLGIVALVACYVPALRASKVDPMVTLRST